MARCLRRRARLGVPATVIGYVILWSLIRPPAVLAQGELQIPGGVRRLAEVVGANMPLATWPLSTVSHLHAPRSRTNTTTQASGVPR